MAIIKTTENKFKPSPFYHNPSVRQCTTTCTININVQPVQRTLINKDRKKLIKNINDKSFLCIPPRFVSKNVLVNCENNQQR